MMVLMLFASHGRRLVAPLQRRTAVRRAACRLAAGSSSIYHGLIYRTAGLDSSSRPVVPAYRIG